MNNVEVNIALSLEGRKQLVPTEKPVLFLAGPIRNAPRWHYDAIRQVIETDMEVFVAAPIRDVPEDIRPFVFCDSDKIPTVSRQRKWELYYLAQARIMGCVIFWLSNESPVKEHPDKVYAHITMLELGTALAIRKQYGSLFNLVIGVDTKFPEWETIKMDIDELPTEYTSYYLDGPVTTQIPPVPVCHTLEDTISTALNLIRKYGK